MTGNLWQDWPVYLLGGAALVFFVYAIINSKQVERENKKKQSLSKDNK